MRTDTIGTGSSSSNDVGCSFACNCGRACTTFNETDPDASDYNNIDAICENFDENDESKCETCTLSNTTCPEDTDCIIVGANTDGTCVDSGVCTADKKTLCDEAYSVVAGKTDNRAKCCPATSGCVRTQIGVKATSTCSVNCGDCLSDFNSQGTAVPSTFCMFGDRLSEFAMRKLTHPLYLFFVMVACTHESLNILALIHELTHPCSFICFHCIAQRASMIAQASPTTFDRTDVLMATRSVATEIARIFVALQDVAAVVPRTYAALISTASMAILFILSLMVEILWATEPSTMETARPWQTRTICAFVIRTLYQIIGMIQMSLAPVVGHPFARVHAD